jgi:capsular exopolysaccharide synthesis family protein
MGKVYDALRRAEEQRSRRVEEAASAPSQSATLPPMPVEPDTEREPAEAPALAERVRAGFKGLGSAIGSLETTGDLNKRRIALLQPDSYVAEQFRSLRARLDALGASRPVGTIAVTSALPGDGKTMASVSLAAVTAMQPGRRVLLVDCDLRQPAVASSLGLRVDAGLAEVLTGSARLDEAIVQVDGSSLHALPVRGIPQNPSELLASENMRKLLEAVSGQYDRVVLDLPPTLGLPDAKTISQLADGVVFVVRADVTPRADVTGAIEVLDRNRILGVVMNGAPRTSGSYERA